MAPSSAPDPKHPAVLESAAVFAFGTLLSRILGLLRDVLIARYFPVDVRDAFINAFRLPNVFRRIFGEGALSASFVPVFVEVLTGQAEPGSDRVKNLLAGVFSVLLVVVSTVSVLAIVFMPAILGALLAGNAYMSVPGKFELTVSLARIMFSFLILISLFSYFMAILNGLHRFALSAVAPCFFNFGVILVAVLFSKYRAEPKLLAWAVIVGGILQAGVVAIGLVREGYFPEFTLSWDGPDLPRVLNAILPATLGFSILQLATIVNMRFASELPAGSHSYLYLADRILELPVSLFVVSIGSALLPTLSGHWVRRDLETLSEVIHSCIRVIVFVALPAAVGIFVLAQPIAEILFVGREFRYDDAVRTAQIIQVYSAGIVISVGVRILSQGFYAIQNVWFPALAGAVALISHIILAFVLTKAFGLSGLAAASVFSAAINLLMLAFAYNAWVGKLDLKNLAWSWIRYSPGIVMMLLALQVYLPLQRFMGSGRSGSRALILSCVIAIGAAAYLGTARLLRVPEIAELFAVFRRKRR